MLLSLGRFAAALDGAMRGSAVHELERSGVAWMTEWMAMPLLTIVCGRSLAVALELAGSVERIGPPPA